MILLIDNYDSFTYNLFQQVSALGAEVKVVRNDALSIQDIIDLQPEAIIISPGPGRPEEAGITVDVVKQLHDRFPILGVCLGHQAIGEAFGSTIVQAKNIMHGKLSEVEYERKGLFSELNGEVEVMRYHSLVIQPDTLHPDFEVIARSVDDHEIMAIQHKKFPVYGLQFHPESIGTEDGNQMIKSFLQTLA